MSKLYKADSAKAAQLVDQIRAELQHEPGIAFAYLYGSFLETYGFHDIDLGIYLDSENVAISSNRTLDLAQRLSARLGILVDVRLLNVAPFPFLYHVLRGKLVLCRNESRLAEVLEDTMHQYFDMAPLLRQSAKEAFVA